MSHPPMSALDFLVCKLLDRVDGGVYRAVDATGDRLLRRDKHIADQVAAVGVLAHHGTAADLRVALEGLLNMQDQQGSAGFVEVTDRNWRPRSSGQVRTLCHQLDAAAALLAAATRLGLDHLRAMAIDLIHRCLATGADGVPPTRVAPDWSTVLVDTCSVNTATAAVGALAVAHTVDPPFTDGDLLRLLAERLTRPISAVDGYLEPSGVSRCGLAARCALALSRAGHALGRDEQFAAAGAILDEAVDRYHDPVDGGFWDRPVPVLDGHAGTTPPVGNGQPPWPVKRTSDAALMLFAAAELAVAGVDTGRAAGIARRAIAAATDRHAGGVFLGIGYDWESAGEPTVVSFRQSWALQQHDELPGSGETEHLDLAQKSAYTQARVAAAQAADATGDRSGDQVAGAAARAERVRVSAGREPSGPDGPHCREVTDVYHTVGALYPLGEPGEGRGRLLDWVRSAQNPDGGFGESLGRVSGVTGTQRAIMALRMGDAVPVAAEGCADFLYDCADDSGGFGEVPGMRGDPSRTGMVVAALSALDAEPAPGRVPEYLHAALAGLLNGAGPGRGSVAAVRRALSALWLLNAPMPDPMGLVEWLRGCQRPEGGFAHRPGATATIVSTGHAVAALALLGARPARPGRCRAWLADRTGGRDDAVAYGAPSSSAEENFALAQAEFVLAGHHDLTWLAQAI